MPNWMSDEDLGLESGDLRQCEHCGQIYSVDSWHTCQASNDAARAEAAQFQQTYFGSGKQRQLVLQVRLECPDTELALHDALQSLACWYDPDTCTQQTDSLLHQAWQVTVLSDQRV